MANKQTKMLAKQEIEKLAEDFRSVIIIYEDMVKPNANVIIAHFGYEINPRYLSHKDYADIIAMSVFLQKHQKNNPIDQELFEKIIKKGNNFAFLRELNKRVRNLVEETLDHGPSYAGVQYAGQMKLEETFKERKI